MLAHKMKVLIPENHQLVIEVPLSFRSGEAELILLAPNQEPAEPIANKPGGSLVALAAELARDPRPFDQLSPEEKRSRLARIRGSARGLASPSAEFAKRKTEETELEESQLGRFQH